MSFKNIIVVAVAILNMVLRSDKLLAALLICR